MREGGLESLIISQEPTPHSKQPGLRLQDQFSTPPSAANSTFNICAHIVRIISEVGGMEPLEGLWNAYC